VRIGESLPDQFISSLVLDPTNPQILYAAGRAGIHKSLDGGTQWQAMNKRLDRLNVRTTVMNPLDPLILYAGTNGSGLYRSIDGGESWTPVPLVLVPLEQAAQTS